MRHRTIRLGGTSLFALGVAVGIAIGSYSGQRADSRALPSLVVPSNTVPPGTAPSNIVPSPDSARKPILNWHQPATVASAHSAAGDATIGITAQSSGLAGGVVVIPVPPGQPEQCSPSHIRVTVGQGTLSACTAVHYDGPITASVANPAIASVSTSGGQMFPRYLYIVGHRAGTTIVRVSYQAGPTTSYRITVSRADTSGR